MGKVELLYGDRSISLNLLEPQVKKILETKPLPKSDSEENLSMMPWQNPSSSW